MNGKEIIAVFKEHARYKCACKLDLHSSRDPQN